MRDDSKLVELADLAGSNCVINTPTSHSGMNVLRSLVAPLHANGRFFSDVTVSGSHEASLGLLLRGEVDVAAIDSVTHALLAMHRPAALEGTRVLCQTEHVPAPPYVTSASLPDATRTLLRRGLSDVLARADMSDVKQALLLDGIETLEEDAYRRIDELESLADELGYRELPGEQNVVPSAPQQSSVAVH